MDEYETRVVEDFYTVDDWEPDGPDLFEGILAGWNTSRRIILSAFQKHMIEKILGQEGQSRRAIQEFMEQISVIAEPMTRTLNEFAKQAQPVIEKRKPPKNGPKYNPHARHGKGGRR